jgi:hypothetical protein
MKNAICFILALAAVAIGAKAEAFTGVITDTMCGAKHDMMKDHPADQCVKMCTKGRYFYALYDRTNVFQLSDQRTPAKFAAQRVKVSGTLDQKNHTIKVSSLEPLTEK